CNVPATYKENGYHLGRWVVRQRTNQNLLSKERRRRLDELGFDWAPYESLWEKGFSHLKLYKERVGDCRVPFNHIENGFKLGSWANTQRTNKNSLSDEHRQRLEEIGFIWDLRSANWDEGLRNLTTYRSREGHCNVPETHKEGGFALGSWVGTQRHNKDRLSEERRQKLDELGVMWDVRETAWEEGFNLLKTYKVREGDCYVPQRYMEKDFPLGAWVGAQRAFKKRRSLSLDRIKKLNDIGF